MFIIYDKDMNIKPFPQGVKPLDIYISSISKNRKTDQVEGSNNRIPRGSTNAERPVSLDFWLDAYDTQDYRLLRDEVYQYLSDEYFYVMEKYQQGKRYKVTLTESYVPDRINQRVAQLKVNLDMYDIFYAESIGTTQDIERNGINTNDGIWGYGMGLIADDEALEYSHTGTSFWIYNAGNNRIHPFEQDLKIKILNAFNSTEFLELKNITNGTFFRLNEGLSTDKELVIDGPLVEINGLNALDDTEHEFIELEPGWNDFELSGTTSARVEFDFRFYYK